MVTNFSATQAKVAVWTTVYGLAVTSTRTAICLGLGGEEEDSKINAFW
jgi:hypothetical protein